MDEAIDSFERRQRARRYRSARVRRVGDLRRKVVLFSIFTFLALWLIVFGQMASGHDPVLASKSKSRSGTDTRRAQSKPAPRQPATALVVDPVTGLVERVPQTGSSAAPPAPVAPPVVTSQS